MGFFGKVLGGGGGALLGAGIGALVPGAGIAGAALGLGVGGAAGQLFGSNEQVEALRRAGRIEEAALLEAQRFQNRAAQAGAPFREAAVGALGQLQEQVQAPLGESARFQQNLQAALGGQQAQLARLGLTDSSAAGLGAARLTSNLVQQEELNRLAILQGLTGGATTGFGQELGALQLQSGLAGRRAQTAAGIGAVRGAGTQGLIQTGLNIAGLFAGRGGGATPAFEIPETQIEPFRG
jgi:hypothetical protein